MIVIKTAIELPAELCELNSRLVVMEKFTLYLQETVIEKLEWTVMKKEQFTLRKLYEIRRTGIDRRLCVPQKDE